MALLNKMQVRGIRSFSPDCDETIEFYSPLTMIVGENGCGKTTIIEALRFACCGSLPPNVKGGQAFVNDPSMTNSSEVKAHVKLSFLNHTGNKCVVTRSLQVLKKNATAKSAAKLEFKTLDATLKTEVTNPANNDEENITQDGGQVKTASSASFKCADMNLIIPANLNISPAIIDNVLLVHQEENLWPLSESNLLKGRLDDIFQSSRYTKALEGILKEKKALIAKLNEIKEKNIEIQTNLTHINHDRQNKKENEQQLEQLTKELHNIKEVIDTLSTEKDEISSIINEYNEKKSKFNQIEIEKKNLENLIKENESNLTENLTANKTLEEIQLMYDEFDINFNNKYEKIQQNLLLINKNKEKLTKINNKLNEVLIEKKNFEKLTKERNEIKNNVLTLFTKIYNDNYFQSIFNYLFNQIDNDFSSQSQPSFDSSINNTLKPSLKDYYYIINQLINSQHFLQYLQINIDNYNFDENNTINVNNIIDNNFQPSYLPSSLTNSDKKLLLSLLNIKENSFENENILNEILFSENDILSSINSSSTSAISNSQYDSSTPSNSQSSLQISINSSSFIPSLFNTKTSQSHYKSILPSPPKKWEDNNNEDDELINNYYILLSKQYNYIKYEFNLFLFYLKNIFIKYYSDKINFMNDSFNKINYEINLKNNENQKITNELEEIKSKMNQYSKNNHGLSNNINDLEEKLKQNQLELEQFLSKNKNNDKLLESNAIKFEELLKEYNNDYSINSRLLESLSEYRKELIALDLNENQYQQEYKKFMDELKDKFLICKDSFEEFFFSINSLLNIEMQNEKEKLKEKIENNEDIDEDDRIEFDFNNNNLPLTYKSLEFIIKQFQDYDQEKSNEITNLTNNLNQLKSELLSISSLIKEKQSYYSANEAKLSNTTSKFNEFLSLIKEINIIRSDPLLETFHYAKLDENSPDLVQAIQYTREVEIQLTELIAYSNSSIIYKKRFQKDMKKTNNSICPCCKQNIASNLLCTVEKNLSNHISFKKNDGTFNETEDPDVVFSAKYKILSEKVEQIYLKLLNYLNNYQDINLNSELNKIKNDIKQLKYNENNKKNEFVILNEDIQNKNNYLNKIKNFIIALNNYLTLWNSLRITKKTTQNKKRSFIKKFLLINNEHHNNEKIKIENEFPYDINYFINQQNNSNENFINLLNNLIENIDKEQIEILSFNNVTSDNLLNNLAVIENNIKILSKKKDFYNKLINLINNLKLNLVNFTNNKHNLIKKIENEITEFHNNNREYNDLTNQYNLLKTNLLNNQSNNKYYNNLIRYRNFYKIILNYFNVFHSFLSNYLYNKFYSLIFKYINDDLYSNIFTFYQNNYDNKISTINQSLSDIHLDSLIEDEGNMQNYIEQLNGKIESLLAENSTLQSEKSNNEAIKLNIKLNIELLNKKSKLNDLFITYNQLHSYLLSNKTKYDEANSKNNKNSSSIKELELELSKLTGMIQIKNDNLANLSAKLKLSNYENIDEAHRINLIDLEALKIVLVDINTYYSALERALHNYHTRKINEVNKVIKELWQVIYQGRDIETIEIESGYDAPPATTTSTAATSRTNRSYNYRVIMKKFDISMDDNEIEAASLTRARGKNTINSTTSLDMRGRCSAGQKVLASIVIRLALAQTFSLSNTNSVSSGSDSFTSISSSLTPHFIALDEPTTNLDSANKLSLAQALARLIIEQNKTNYNYITSLRNNLKELDHKISTENNRLTSNQKNKLLKQINEIKDKLKRNLQSNTGIQLICITHDEEFVDMIRSELNYSSDFGTPEYYFRIYRELDEQHGRYFSHIRRMPWEEKF